MTDKQKLEKINKIMEEHDRKIKFLVEHVKLKNSNILMSGSNVSYFTEEDKIISSTISAIKEAVENN